MDFVVRAFFGPRAERPAARPRLRRPTLEALEERLALSRTVVLDFEGPTLTAAQFSDGQWEGQSQRTFSSFRSLFTAGASAVLDIDRVGTVNVTDADLAISRIVARVRPDYGPYDLRIVTGSVADNDDRLTDAQAGDMIMVSAAGVTSAAVRRPSAWPRGATWATNTMRSRSPSGSRSPARPPRPTSSSTGWPGPSRTRWGTASAWGTSSPTSRSRTRTCWTRSGTT